MFQKLYELNAVPASPLTVPTDSSRISPPPGSRRAGSQDLEMLCLTPGQVEDGAETGHAETLWGFVPEP